MRLATATLLTAALLIPASTAVGAPASNPAPGSAEAGAQHIAAIEAWQRQMFAKASPSVVFISDGDSLGSGFFVSDDGWILTNAHVVHGKNLWDVVLSDGQRYRGRVMERAKDDIDLALIKIDAVRTPAMRLEAAPVEVGSWIGSVGHGLGGVWTYNTGMVSNVYPAGKRRSLFQTNVPLNPGNSGGPMFTREGRVVGVVTAGINGANNVNFGIRVDMALEYLPKLGLHCECWVIDTKGKDPVFLDGESVGSGPRVVIPAQDGVHELAVVHKGKRSKRKLAWPHDRYVDLSK